MRLPASSARSPAGGFHSCGLGADGTVVCWGSDNVGQSDAPGGQYRAVSAGRSHSCGLRTDGTVACWGDSSFGGADSPEGQFLAVTAGI